MEKIEDIVNLDILKYIDKKLQGKAVLGGRRALALAGITFRRPFSSSDDRDFVIKHLSIRHTLFGDGTFQKVIHNRDYGRIDAEHVEDQKHYQFEFQTTNCLFVNKDLVTTTYRGIKIADPEQILAFKRQYVEFTEKHKIDFERMSQLQYKLGHL